MNRLTLTTLALCGSLAASAADTPVSEERDWTDAVKDALVVYDNPDTFLQKVQFSTVVQYQMASVQPNGSNGLHLKDGAGPFNDEFRRVWAAVNFTFDTDTELFIETRVGGMPWRNTYPGGGHSRRDYSYFSLFYLILTQQVPGVEGLTFTAGKLQPYIGVENMLASAALKCPDRSMILGQYGFDSNWGFDFTYRPNKADTFMIQFFANDAAAYAKSNEHPDRYRDGRGFKGEFGWEDKGFIVTHAAHKFGMNSQGFHEVTLQYAHDFCDAYHGKRNPGANYYGLGVKDAVSLAYEYKHDRFSMLSNALFNFETIGGHGSNNMGFFAQPVYALTPHVDLVARYTVMMGDDACCLGADRYTCTQTTADVWVDSLHAFYLGANYYFSARNPDAAKLMFGAEYITARKNGSDCHNGWAFLCCLRFSF